MNTREEHLAWCKERALAYLNHGEVDGAIASMASDLGKHPETAGHIGIQIGLMLRISGHLGTVAEMRGHIEGYN